MDYPCAKFGDFSFSRFGSNACGETDTYRYADGGSTPYSRGVSNYWIHTVGCSCKFVLRYMISNPVSIFIQ